MVVYRLVKILNAIVVMKFDTILQTNHELNKCPLPFLPFTSARPSQSTVRRGSPDEMIGNRNKPMNLNIKVNTITSRESVFPNDQEKNSHVSYLSKFTWKSNFPL